MDIRQAFAVALKTARKARGRTQEDFSDVSSRTYLSTLERGLKSPTLDKLQNLAKVLELHPLTILALTYTLTDECSNEELLNKVANELKRIPPSS